MLNLKEAFCQRNQRQELTDSEASFEAELSIMFCAHSKKRRKRKREACLAPSPAPRPPRPAPSGTGKEHHPLADESLAGLFHIYSSAAEFMIIVLKPWQCALCPGRLCAFVILSPVLCSSLLPGDVQILAEGQIFFMVATNPQIPPSPHTQTQGRRCTKEKSTLGAGAGENKAWACIPKTLLVILGRSCFGESPIWYPE